MNKDPARQRVPKWRNEPDDMFHAELWVKPHAMKRPRQARGGHFYSPSAGEVRVFQSELQACGFHEWAKRHPSGPVEVGLIFVLERPKNTRFVWPISKRHGDIDNHIKTLLDAINGFVPDERVVSVQGGKIWGDAAYVEVWVEDVGDDK